MSDLPSPLEPGIESSQNDVLDIQHDPFPEEDQGTARRTPHLGHALLFLALTAFIFLIFMVLVALLLKGKTQVGNLITVVSLGTEAATYVLTLVAAYWLFPLIWKRSFLGGIHWNGLVAKRNWARLVSAGVLLSVVAQFAEQLVTGPAKPEIEQFMKTPAGAWSVMLLGTLLAPLMEEIAFRGFLLPALATAYDWLSLDRTPAGLQRWTTTTANSSPALIFAALFSSLLFALIHAPQLQYAWGPVGLLFGVSLVLALVRVRTHSTACSTLVHLTYNLTIFVAAFVATGGFRHLDRL
ncbi:MAG: CPBP family intramembrane glutamic endopeptidase [Janthinobacterium lividum]